MKVEDVKPLFDRVLVRRMEAEGITASGIIVPDTAKEKPTRGEVISVGCGLSDRPIEVSVSDTVLFTKYAGTEVEVDDEGEFLIVRYSDVIAIIEND